MNFKTYSDKNLKEYIIEIKNKYAGRIIIPAHHYIHSDIVGLADFTGDSYKLAVDVSRSDAEFIVFCGVRFMAEGAKILAAENQHILHPEPDAGCPMAEMIDGATAEHAVAKIRSVSGREIIPVVYMNSYADSKSFCGKNGGAVCTSSNAGKIIKHYLDKGQSLFFFPDYNLGINVSYNLNIPPDYVVRVGRDLSFEKGKEPGKAKMFLWDGFCPVHHIFEKDDVVSMREKYPAAKIIVHPETKREVVSLSDMTGSTRKIYDTIADSGTGTQWIAGTETTFVNRLADTFRNKTVLPLRVSPCKNMVKINLLNIAGILKSVEDYITGSGPLLNEVFVDNKLKVNAKKALQGMISITDTGVLNTAFIP